MSGYFDSVTGKRYSFDETPPTIDPKNPPDCPNCERMADRIKELEAFLFWISTQIQAFECGGSDDE